MNTRKQTKTIVFRVDASVEIGLGHVMRELAIAEELAKKYKIIFASLYDSTNVLIAKKKFEVFSKKTSESEVHFLSRIKEKLQPDVLVFDTKLPYTISQFRALQSTGTKIVTIDMTCKGIREADAVIFPIAHMEKSYRDLKVKSGPEYLIIRDEIRSLRKNVRKTLPKVPRIVVTAGGTDPKGITEKLMEWLQPFENKAHFRFLGGFGTPRKLLKGTTPYSEKELEKADIAICTFGQTMYELIYLGIPTLVVSQKKEDAKAAARLKRRFGVIEDTEFIGELTQKKLLQILLPLLGNGMKYRKMRERCLRFSDGKGVVRIARIIAGGKD